MQESALQGFPWVDCCLTPLKSMSGTLERAGSCTASCNKFSCPVEQATNHSESAHKVRCSPTSGVLNLSLCIQVEICMSADCTGLSTKLLTPYTRISTTLQEQNRDAQDIQAAPQQVRKECKGFPPLLSAQSGCDGTTAENKTE